MPAYGVFSNAGQGHVVTSILIAMVAMVFTAMSYGRMARVYPSAGSAYTYVGRELHPCARLRHRLEHDDGLHAQSADLHHLVRQGNGGSAERDALSDSLSRPGLAVVLCLAVYRAQPARRENFRAHQPDALRHHGRGHPGVLLVHDSLHFSSAAISGVVFPASVLQSRKLSP